jgi:hypothetical protein
MIAVASVAALSAGAALARNETGTITNINAKADQITLSSGTTINLPEHIEVQSFKVGERVAVKYTVQKSGIALASKVHPIKKSSAPLYGGSLTRPREAGRDDVRLPRGLIEEAMPRSAKAFENPGTPSDPACCPPR